MSNGTRIFLGLCFVFLGVFWEDIKERIPDFSPEEKTKIEISEPLERIKNRTQFADVVTDPEDKLKLTIFNKVFSDRSVDYDATNQDINDIYVLAASKYFKGSLRGKYSNYGESLTEMMRDILGDDIHKLTKEEKEELSQYFSGLAWQLNQ